MRNGDSQTAETGRVLPPRPTARGDKLEIVIAEDLLAKVLRLPRNERARLAEQVLSSLEESDEQVAAAWASELERRSREVAEGRVQAVDWDTARAGILKELGQRRAPRSSS